MVNTAKISLGNRLWTLLAIPVFMITLGANMLLAANEKQAANDVTQDSEAKVILLKMASLVAEAKAFSVTTRSGYDAIQSDGQRIEFGEKRQTLLQRPSHLLVESVRSDGDRGQLFFDGQTITAFKVDDNVFARIEKTGTLDNVLVYLSKELKIILPMARMLHTDFPQYLEKAMTSINYVEDNPLFDIPTDHIAVRSNEVDMQIWVAQGRKPLPRRIVLTYRNAPGQPQFWTDFLDWDLSPMIDTDSFTFTPNEGAERVPFIVSAQPKGSIPGQKGESQ
jgi:hypothetical protein